MPVTASSDELLWNDALGMAELVRTGSVSPNELVDAAIARLDKLEPQLHVLVSESFERARKEAAGPLPDGPFRGVPFLLKDAVQHSEGDPYGHGLASLKGISWRSPHDTELARRYRQSGLVLLGRTKVPELTMSSTTEPLAYGAAHNPWALDRSPGGSSGGSAAAVAAGIVPLAHGNDMGGSIRIPSSCCGAVGLKPSRNRTSFAPDYGEYWGPLTHEHVITRSVRDSAAALDATAGPVPGDLHMAPPPARPWLLEVGTDPGRLRIGFLEMTGILGNSMQVNAHNYEHLPRSLPHFGAMFKPFANFDMNTRYGTPFSDWYGECPTAMQGCISYPGPNSVTWTAGGMTQTIDPFNQGCGNAHFPPNGRQNYDQTNTQTVLSTCEHYGLHDGPGGKDLQTPYDVTKLDPWKAKYKVSVVGGAWYMYWFESFPGLDNKAKLPDGTPMKNWWVYLYY